MGGLNPQDNVLAPSAPARRRTGIVNPRFEQVADQVSARLNPTGAAPTGTPRAPADVAPPSTVLGGASPQVGAEQPELGPPKLKGPQGDLPERVDALMKRRVRSALGYSGTFLTGPRGVKP